MLLSDKRRSILLHKMDARFVVWSAVLQHGLLGPNIYRLQTEISCSHYYYFFFFLALINIVNEGCDHAIYPFMHTVHSSCPLKSLRLWFWCNFLSLKFPFRPLSFVLSFSRCRNFKIGLFPVSTKCYKCVQ